MKQSNDKPGMLKATSSIVQASSMLVLVWLIAMSPNRKRVTVDRPELDAGKMRIFYMDEEPGLLAEVSKKDVSYDLCRSFTPGLQCLRISRELEDEAVFAIDILLSYASSIGKHSSCCFRIQTLKGSSQWPNRSFCRVSTKPWSVSPHNLAITPCMNLAPSNSKLHVPHVRIHLPDDKPTRLGSPSTIPTLHYLRRSFNLIRQHLKLSHGISILN
nr:hypothetical protein ACMD2_04623 [Ipomoea batatas]